MSTINELYLQIEELNKKIEDESQKRLKRKLMIEDEIKNLEEEKRRSGLHGDFQSVQKFNTKSKGFNTKVLVEMFMSMNLK